MTTWSTRDWQVAIATFGGSALHHCFQPPPFQIFLISACLHKYDLWLTLIVLPPYDNMILDYIAKYDLWLTLIVLSPLWQHDLHKYDHSYRLFLVCHVSLESLMFCFGGVTSEQVLH